jgi:UDP-N-acetylmuramoyl-L-alanyl-D-glutamate--2,6-diaminopimelate ligase
MKNLLKKLIPDFVFSLYHWKLAWLGALIYGFPSRKLIVIGVTGTKGKTTTCNLIAQILNGAGLKTGLATTVNFRIGEREWVNEYKQTMLGRFKLQKLLRQMVDEGCKYAVIETSSEGILQYRHKGINYSVAVFTNLSPEHIERHGSFANYRAAKLKLCEVVSKNARGIGVYNLDDQNVDYFLKCDIRNKYGYGTHNKYQLLNFNKISGINLSPNRTEFSLNNEKFQMPLVGEFNIYNAAAAICVAQSQGIGTDKIKEILKNAKPTPGRLEVIKAGQPFTVVVDYAHEPASLEAAYKAIKVFNPKKIIALLGAQGGGRDKSKRPELGRIAGQYADKIIVTNEDPYDENPSEIINDVAAGVKNKDVIKIIQRREAIRKALSLAEAGDTVILTGKGGEVWMCIENSKKIPWNERKIVEEELANLSLTQK